VRYEWLVPLGIAGAVAPVAQIAYSADYMSVEAAQKAAFADATTFEPVVASAAAKADVARDAGRFTVDPRIWRVSANGRALGWFIVDEVIGKQELITYGVALDSSGAVTSLDILAYRETHGDAIRLPAWRSQFTGKRAGDPVKLDTDIRNISGATLSCRHVTEGVHRLLLLYEHALAHG
jgi:Na+-translocating ferredoxin:NAD+ oxidoreductase RnfG subunit